MQLHVWLIFVTMIGACIGSFLNVVVYRLPEGKSIVKPPSACPKCGYVLKWYDNVPVLAWFYLGGKCRKCKTKISFQYPLIEAITALLFGGWFFICYYTDMRPGFSTLGLANTWPIYIAYVVMFAGLLAATLIDARYYIIPLEITWIIAGLALVVYPLAVMFFTVEVVYEPPPIGYIGKPYPSRLAIIDLLNGPALGMCLGGVLGLIIANVLLWCKVIPRSFAELTEQEQQATEAKPDDPEAFLAHPHPRREVLKEAVFLALPIAGAAAGWFTWGQLFGPAVNAPGWLQAAGGVLAGYLAGGAMIWFTRILGTLGFGKEAMGLGDVHVLAAIGAVCGWRAAVLTFFIAPFIGLGYTLVAQALASAMKRKIRVIPYGPHLAMAALIYCIFREPILARVGVLFHP